MTTAILIIAVLVVLAAAAVWYAKNRDGKREKSRVKSEEELRLEELERKKRENQACKACYQYLSRLINRLAKYHNQNRFEKLTRLDSYPKEFEEDMELVLNRVSGRQKELLTSLLSCLEATEEVNEEETKKYVSVPDNDKLKQVFYECMLPFYPYYYSQMAEGKVRYSSLVSEDMLKLFHQLTGKRYSLGYHNKHNTGVPSYEYRNGRFRVYDKNNHVLCDASFKNGEFYNGFRLLPGQKDESGQWNVSRELIYEEGKEREKTVHYHYEKKI